MISDYEHVDLITVRGTDKGINASTVALEVDMKHSPSILLANAVDTMKDFGLAYAAGRFDMKLSYWTLQKTVTASITAE